MLGILIMVISVTIHVLMIPYLSLTLLAGNTATSIIVATILSSLILGEVFIMKYDLTALIFISLGCACLVLNANTT